MTDRRVVSPIDVVSIDDAPIVDEDKGQRDFGETLETTETTETVEADAEEAGYEEAVYGEPDQSVPPEPRPDKTIPPVLGELTRVSDARQVLEGILAGEEVDAPLPDPEEVASSIGPNLEEATRFLGRYPRPSDIDDHLRDLEADVDRDTQAKLGQISTLHSELRETEGFVEKAACSEALKEKATLAVLAIERQLEAKRNQYEHWLGSERFEMGAPTFNPDEIIRLEEELSFAKQAAERIHTIFLSDRLKEYDIVEARMQRYTNVEVDGNGGKAEMIIAARGPIESNMVTFGGKSNVAPWTVSLQIVMASAICIGEALGSPIMLLAETTETLQKRIGQPDIYPTISFDTIIPKLGFGLGDPKVKRDELQRLRSLNKKLEAESDKRGIKIRDIAYKLYENYEGMSKGDVSSFATGVTQWVSQHRKLLLIVGAVIIAILVIVLLLL